MRLYVFSHRNFQRLELWLRRVSFSRKLLYTLLVLTFISGVITYLSFLKGVNNNHTLGLIKINILLLTAFITLFASRLFFNRKKSSLGPRFHSRLVLIFSFLAITPTIVVYFTASTLFERGVNALGGDFTKNTIYTSTQFANQLQIKLESNLKYIANHVKAPIVETIIDSSNITKEQKAFVNNLKTTYEISEIAFLNRDKKVIYQSNPDLPLPLFDNQILEALENNNFVAFFPAKKTTLAALLPLETAKNTFLYIEKSVDPILIKHFEFINATNQEFIKIQKNRWLIPLMFMLNYGLFVLISLAIAIGVGIMLADHIAYPITQLVAAAQRIRKGHLDTRVKIKPNIIEFLGLAKAFNLMVNELQSKKNKLEQANQAIERRNSFIETTLSSLSSGIIGLDETNHIQVINNAAVASLKLDAENSIGKHILDIIPEITDLLYSEQPSHADKIKPTDQHLVILEREGSLNYFNILISITNSNNDIRKVLTIENMTELHLAQKKAAWGDVARRVAHEIKNPLTPIQLSAERLKRKLSKLLPEQETEQLNINIETIIRQVTEIERIVREFSQLSRMPKPHFSETNVITILKNCINLQSSAYEKIEFNLSIQDNKRKINILCDDQLLGQAFTNILKNSTESLLEINNTQDFAPKVHILLTLDDKNVTIQIMDNGKGFPLNMIDKFLEPYVTTKEKGTGLGLAISRKIIEDHNGKLMLSNLKSAGAEVKIILPLQV